MNSLGHERFGQRFAGDILKCIFFKGNVYILIQISLKFVPKRSWQYIITSSVNGWAPNRRQFITWTMISNFIDTRQQWVNPTLPVRNPLRWRHNDHDSAPQITSLTIVYSNIYSGADQSKHQSSASLVFVRRIHRGPVNSPHKWPVTRNMFPFDDVIMPEYKSYPLSEVKRAYWIRPLGPSVCPSLSVLYL